MAKVKITTLNDRSISGTCERCNKNVSIAIIGGNNCNHVIIIHKANSLNDISVIEIKEK